MRPQAATLHPKTHRTRRCRSHHEGPGSRGPGGARHRSDDGGPVGFILDHPDQASNQLPTEHELGETERVAVECSRLHSLLVRLAAALPGQ